MAVSFINSESERRRFKRVGLGVPVKYKYKYSNEFGSTLTQNISAGGARLIFDKFIPVNTEFMLELGLDKFTSMLSALGKVVWVQKAPHCERYLCGLEFEEIDEQQKKDIFGYVNSRRF